MGNTIYLAGDSTCAYNDIRTYPATGWGQVLHLYLEPSIIIKNYAMNGRSSKSFIHEGRLDVIAREIEEGDLLLIQFGHNDQKEDEERRTEPFGSYQNYLMQYIQVARNKKAVPVLITPLFRRHFDELGHIKTIKAVHGQYPEAMIQLATREKVHLIDLCSKSMRWLDEIGDEASKAYYMYFYKGMYLNYPEGLADNTHLRYLGAIKAAEIIAEGLADGFQGYKVLKK